MGSVINVMDTWYGAEQVSYDNNQVSHTAKSLIQRFKWLLFRLTFRPARTAAEYNTDAEHKTNVVPVAVIVHLV